MTDSSSPQRPGSLARITLLTWLLTSAVSAGCQSDERLDDPAALAKCTAEVTRALSEGAGILLPKEVPVVLLTSEEAKQRRRAFVASRKDETGFTAAVDFMADAMFSGRLLGRYLPDEKVVYVFADVLREQGHGDDDAAMDLLFPVLAHELVHAYDDQVYDSVPDPSELAVILEDPSALLGIHTLMSLLEGRASYASYLACRAAGVEPLPVPTLEQARRAVLVESDGSVGMEVLSGLGNSLGRMKFMQYVYGWNFAERAYAYGGEPFFANVFGHLPLSMEELEDFDLFVVRWAEEMEAQFEAAEAADELEAAADVAEAGAGS